MNFSRSRDARAQAAAFHFENLEPRNLLAADLANLAFADVGNAGLLYQLSEQVPVDQRMQVLKLHSGASDSDSFQLKRVDSDRLGYSHFKFQQFSYGIPVENGTYTVHAKNGLIESISGEFIEFGEADPSAKVHQRDALIQAINHVTSLIEGDGHDHHDHHGEEGLRESAVERLQPIRKPHFAWENASGHLDLDAIPKAELAFVETGEQQVSLAYKFDIYSQAPVFKADVFVDAVTGDVIKHYEMIHTADTPASGTSLYNGVVPFTADSFGTPTNYRLQANAGVGIPTVITLDMRNSGDYADAVDVVSANTSFNLASQRIGVQTHYGAESIVDFYAERLGRNSYDANGTTLVSYFSFSNGYNNAFWNGSVLTFGDGDGTNYFPLVSLDIVGHEFTHGVIETTADLIYQFESGALNESFADIMGEASENFATGTQDWATASEIVNGPGAIRSFQDPKSLGDPDTYLGQNWFSGSDDAGGVHTNGTVQNHWFYILSEGKTGTNDNGDSYDVTGIGIEDATQIAYRNLATYLTPASQYADARVGSIQSAIDLFGVNSPQHLATEAAWDAVGVYALDLRFQPELVSEAIGSLIYSDKTTSEVFFDGYVDDGKLKLDAGQAVSIAATSNTLIPSITFKDPAGNVIQSVTGTNGETILQSAAVPVSGEYTIEVVGENGSVGTYSAELLLNANFERESLNGQENDSMATAEDLDATAIPLGTDGADRLAVMSFLGEGKEILGGDDFESGVYGPQWSLYSSLPDGKIDNWGGPGTHSGTQAMYMHHLPAGDLNLNEAILTVDLEGQTDTTLEFWLSNIHEEPHYMPLTSYTGHHNGDGVSLSVDGNTWYPMLDQIVGAYQEFIYYEYDLDQFAADNGIILGSNTQFKFQQYDDYPIYTDGAGWDDIFVSRGQPGEDWYSFSLAGGESASLSAMAVTGSQDVLIELYDSTGNLVQTGSTFEGQSGISQFVNSGSTDTFYVKVLGSTLDYSLVVTRGADIDIEPNDAASAQDITDVGGVLGSVYKYRFVTADPDSFVDGAILDTLFSDLTLSNEIGNGSVWAADTDDIFDAPTGRNVFAPDFGASDGWNESVDELRVEFASLQPQVSIDVGSDDNLDIGWIKAYGDDGALLEQQQTGGIPFGGTQTLTIQRPTADIAYIVASGFDFHITPLDNLQYTDFSVDEDFYSVNAVPGQQLDFHGILPGDGSFEFDNGLDTAAGSMLGMQLLDPNGNIVATHSEVISHTATLNGDYVLRVYAEEGRGEYYISKSLPGSSPIDKTIDASKFLDGIAQTAVSNANVSDDVYLQLAPSPTTNPAKQIVDGVFLAIAPMTNPSSFGFRVEASINGGPVGDVVQEIWLWNEVNGAWDVVDSRAASGSDLVVDAYVSGNGSDYVHPLTSEILARVSWRSPQFGGAPFFWTVDVDQAGWLMS